MVRDDTKKRQRHAKHGMIRQRKTYLMHAARASIV
jgi:hypothetical protein